MFPESFIVTWDRVDDFLKEKEIDSMRKYPVKKSKDQRIEGRMLTRSSDKDKQLSLFSAISGPKGYKV